MTPPGSRNVDCSSAPPIPPPGISIIVPVYNERRTIEELVRRVLERTDVAGWNRELIIVDDGSTDGTPDLLRRLAVTCPIRVLRHPKNRGKGAAIRTGLAVAVNELTIIQDADLEYDPGDIPELVKAFLENKADVVLGSRALGVRAGRADRRRNIYAIGVAVLNLAVRGLYGLRVTDEATCYKLFRTRDLLRMRMTCERFEFCPEVIAKSARLGFRVVEVPIGYSPRSTAEGKKIGIADAWTALLVLWRFRRWTPKPTPIESNDPPGDTPLESDLSMSR